MKKRWMFAALVAILALAMIGCSDGSDPGTSPSVTSVTVTAAATSVSQGGTLQFTADVVVVSDASKEVTWSITGATKAGTAIDSNGLLTVAGDEPATTPITVTATSTFDTSKAGSATVTVALFVEKLFLENGAYAVYKFTIPAGSTWADYEKLTVEYKVDATNLAITPRNNRLMGPYYAADFVTEADGSKKGPGEAQIDKNGARSINMNLNWTNNRHIMDNKTTGWAGLGITDPDTWTTVTYDITGDSGHGDFKDSTNPAYVGVPAGTYTGDIYFGLGVNADYGAKGKPAAGITQLVRNIKLVPFAGAGAEVTSTGSGFAEQTFIANVDPVLYSWRGVGENATVAIPKTPCDCKGLGENFCGCWDCTFEGDSLTCTNNCCTRLPPAAAATEPYTVTLDADAIEGTGAEVTADGIKNTESWAAAANGGPYYIKLNFPENDDGEQLEIRSYEKYTVKAKFYDASDNELVHSGSGTTADPYTNKPNGYFRFKTEVAANSGNAGGGQWNINYDTVNKTIDAGILALGPAVQWIAVQNGDASTENKTVRPAYVEIIEITFFPAGAILPATQDYTMPLTGLTVKNATAMSTDPTSNQYDMAVVIPLTFSTGYDIRSYTKFTVKAKFFSDSTTEIPTANSLGQVQFTKGVGSDWYTGRIDPDIYDLNQAKNGTAGTVQQDIPQAVLDAGSAVVGLTVKRSDRSVVFVEITEITFHP